MANAWWNGYRPKSVTGSNQAESNHQVINGYRPNPITGSQNQKALETHDSTDDNQTNQHRNLAGLNPIIRGPLQPDQLQP